MKPAELRALAKTMREYGIATFKADGVEITLSTYPLGEAGPILEKAPIRPLNAPAQVEPEITHKVEELTSLMKLSDSDLVDQLFPDHTQEESA